MNRKILIAGLIIPGGGSLLRGAWGHALLGLWTVTMLVALATVALVAANAPTAVDSASVTSAARMLAWPLRIPPTVPVTVALALAVHGLCAWGAARDRG